MDHRRIPLALLSVWMALPAHAAEPVTADFSADPPTAVVVDVLELPAGTQVGNNLAATQISRDSALQPLWRFDLATVAGFPVACELKSYLVTFVPDGANCAAAGTPTACASIQIDAGSGTCASGSETATHVDYYHSATVISGLGISAEVIAYYGRRGLLPIKWRKIRKAADGDFATPDSTKWEVYFYTVENAIPRLCTAEAYTDPNSGLPGRTQCH